MPSQSASDLVSRRAALAGLGAGGLGLALAARGHSASAQEAGDLAGHPIVGTWLAFPQPPGSPPLCSVSHYTAAGEVILGWPATQAGPQGVIFTTGWLGVWEPTGERSIHFTAVQVHSDADGNYLGTLSIEGHPTVSEDGQSFVDDDPTTAFTLRDPAGNVLSTFPSGAAEGEPVRGTRMGVGLLDFGPAAVGTPAVATPAS